MNSNPIVLKNKHKTKVTNLVAPKERAEAVHTQIGSMQITPVHRNVLQNSRAAFTDPLLNMLTTFHTINDASDTNR